MALLISPEVSSYRGCRIEVSARFSPHTACNSVSRISVCRSVQTDFSVNLSSKVKDLKNEAKVFDIGNGMVYGNLSALVKEPSTTTSLKQDDEEEKRNFYLNMGYAVRCLREEFPALFYKEPTFDIFRDDIVFKDPLNQFAGIENYKSIFWALRFYGRMFFRALWIDIISVWQPVDNMIIVRWTAHGVPRVPWESQGRFDGTSEYKLDKFGKIYEHRVHNIALRAPPKFKILAVQDMIQSIGCPSTPKPTYFESSDASFEKIMPQLNFTGVGDYVSSLLTQASDAHPEES